MVDCKSCSKVLDENDRQKSTGGYWKNCHRCRESHTSKKRFKRGLAPRAGRVEKKPVARKYSRNFGFPDDGTVQSPPSSRYTAFERELTSFERLRKDYREHEDLRSIYAFPTKLPFPTGQAVEFDCSVCGDSIDVGNFPDIERCSHEPRVCQECFANWLTSQVGTTSWDRIVCPSTGCGVLISHEEVKDLVTPETFTRYDELSIRSFLNSDAQFRYCLRPGCSSGQVHDSGEEGNIFRCNACAFLVCTTHDEAFHAGETCAEYDGRKSCERKVEDDASAEIIQGTTKQCPSSSCAVRIEKNEGCDHMTCRRCSHEFCWVCLAPYSGPQGIWRAGNSVHVETCKHWRTLPGAVRVEPAPMAPVTPPVVPVPNPCLGQTQAQSAINLDDSDDDDDDFQLDVLLRRRLVSLT